MIDQVKLRQKQKTVVLVWSVLVVVVTTTTTTFRPSSYPITV